MAIRIQVLDQSHARQLGSLRATAYRIAYGEAVDTGFLYWGPADDAHTNLGLFVNDRLVSAYRLDTVTTDEELEEQLQVPANTFAGIRLPCGALCRAATLPSMQGRGYHHALRLAALELAHRRGLEIIVSTTITGGPAARLFEGMGYALHAHPSDWKGFLQPEGIKQVNVLDLATSRAQAFGALEEHLLQKGLRLTSGQFDGSPLQIDPVAPPTAPRPSMPLLTHRNHFVFGYNGVPFTWRRSPSDTWFVKYGRCEREPLRFDEECKATARTIRANTTDELHVLFSGGVDSEVTLRSFVDSQIPVEAAILRFADDLNLHDISWAVITCEELGVPYTVYDLDLVSFWKGEAKRYAEATTCISPQLLSTMWLIDQVPGYPILGSAECLFVKRGQREIEAEVERYEATTWDLWEKERIAAWYRHFRYRGREGCPGFFQYTPEIMLAYLNDPMVQDLVNNRLPGEFTTEGIKASVYEQYFPLKKRTKYTGFEKVVGYEKEVRADFSRRYGAYNQTFITSLADLREMLSPAPAEAR